MGPRRAAAGTEGEPVTIKIEDLDEFEGLTADMVRAWMRAKGWTVKRAERFWEWWEKGAEGEKDGFWLPAEFGRQWFWIHALAAVYGLSVQSLLGEINPRMRAGLPTKAEMDAHPGFWIGHMGGKYPAPTIGYFMRLIGGFEWRSGNAVWDMVALERAAQSEYPCAFWPCDQHGNKTRRGA